MAALSPSPSVLTVTRFGGSSSPDTSQCPKQMGGTGDNSEKAGVMQHAEPCDSLAQGCGRPTGRWGAMQTHSTGIAGSAPGRHNVRGRHSRHAGRVGAGRTPARCSAAKQAPSTGRVDTSRNTCGGRATGSHCSSSRPWSTLSSWSCHKGTRVQGYRKRTCTAHGVKRYGGGGGL
jgi:hypothetical protein